MTPAVSTSRVSCGAALSSTAPVRIAGLPRNIHAPRRYAPHAGVFSLVGKVPRLTFHIPTTQAVRPAFGKPGRAVWGWGGG